MDKKRAEIICRMYSRGLVSFEDLVSYICDIMSCEYIKFNNEIEKIFK